MLEALFSPFRPKEVGLHGLGGDGLFRDVSGGLLGVGGGDELEGDEGWIEDGGRGEDGSQQVQDPEEGNDIDCDELLMEIMSDHLGGQVETQRRAQPIAIMDGDRQLVSVLPTTAEADRTRMLLGSFSVEQKPQIAPDTPAVPQVNYGTTLIPSANQITQGHSWRPDLNESGEGLEDTSEVLSFDNADQHTTQHSSLEDLDFDRPQRDDGNGSELASSFYHSVNELLSPDVSRPSRSNSSSPIAMFDTTTPNQARYSNFFERNSTDHIPRASSISAHPVVDLTSDDSDGDEEESELREIDGGFGGKRKLPGWAAFERKRPRDASNWPQLQPSGYPFTNFPFAQMVKSVPELSSLPNRSQTWHSNSKYSMQSSVTSATSFKGVPGSEFHKNLPAYRETYSSSGLSMAQRTSSGEVSTSYDRGIPRVLPGTIASSITALANGVQRLVAPIDPVKRSEELAYQAVIQAFSLADEKEETCPDEGLLSMSLLKHQRIALSWMVKRESGRQDPCGGILADDQGLGKTISTISLILKNRAPIKKSGSSVTEPSQIEGSMVDLDDDDDELVQENKRRSLEADSWRASNTSLNSSPQQPDDPKSSQSSSKGRPAAGTLVVCPTSVLRQWAQELRDKVATEAELSVLVYHGSNRTKDPYEIAKYDVVLSTYSIVSMEVPKQPLPEDKEEESRRNPSDYGFVPFSKPKKEKPEKAKKSKAKGKGLGADGDSSFAPDSGPLARVAWFRVVLDEAQSIKNYRTQVARAAWGLRAKRRWCLSGTPIQNSVDDLFSYFRFLRYFPWDVYKKFQRDIKEPVGRNPTEGYRRLQAILKPIVLRRTKTSFIDGEPIVNLPPRIVKLQQAEFSIDERSFYSNLESESRAQFQMYAAAGTVQNNYVNILWMLLRLRQACDHPMLVKKCHKSEAFQKVTLDAVRKLPPPQRAELIQCLEGGRTICHICQDAPEDPVVSICAHVFCRQCISEQMANGDDTTCRYPKCRKALNSSLLFTLAALKDPGIGDNGSPCDGEIAVVAPNLELEPTWKTSSKIDAVISTLQALPKISVLVEDGKIIKGTKAEKFLNAEALEFVPEGAQSCAMFVPSEALGSVIGKVESTEKAIVFSQWTSMLDLLETPLKHAGLCYRRLDGTMSVVARDRAVSDFNTRPEVTVMIMSLKAASLGLNMVAACHVLLLDVWWNPTTEDQAIDRAHRIGQTRTVNVSRFTVKNTIEDRILALQERKRQIVASAFGENEGGEQKTRLTVEDLRYLFRV